ncbi:MULTISPECIES: SRPBCC family protein [unclassified Streptomyces]|uniref:SRPBCC family protein n=1 Tax=unclassified Streptomyces TaxID=2593676 RepID=UPI0003626E26|nr:MULTISPECIES: SRPBCC family protein [unclassified Streptomyces]MYX33394.1 cyclase [Streptomyces sp. SID8377]
MAGTTGGGEQGSGLDQLRGAFTNFLGAQVQNLADKASDKLGDVTSGLQGVADGGGVLPKAGLRMLQGDSPVKALIGEKAKSIKDSVVGKVKEAFGGGGGKGRKSGTSKVMNIIEAQDVGVPLRFAYDHWTQYEKFSSFTKGVRSASRGKDADSDWKVKVGPSTRGWKATTQEQVPDERIVWTSEGAKGTTRGCVSFHELAPSLTRIVLVVEYYPSGFFEKTGNIWRAQGRRLRLDFKHFLRYVTLTDEEADGWRGEIRDGEVVRTHEEAIEEEEQAADEDGSEEPDEDAEDEYPEDEEEGEEYSEEGEEEYPEEDEEDEEEEDEEYPEDEEGEDEEEEDEEYPEDEEGEDEEGEDEEYPEDEEGEDEEGEDEGRAPDRSSSQARGGRGRR